MRHLPSAVIFLGAFLLFLLEPLIGRTLLPVFGGSSSVWVTCIVAFQVLLLAGYGYAFLPSRRSQRTRWLHILLLAASIPLTFGMVYWQNVLTRYALNFPPVVGVLICVLLFGGVVFVILSANSTVVQAWSAKAFDDREVYRLYVVSNVGSLCGLLAYPVLIEPFLSVPLQWALFCSGVAFYAVLSGMLCWKSRSTQTADVSIPSSATVAHVCLRDHVLWFALPLLSGCLLTATTTYLTTDVMPIPLLWCLLLAIFLGSYVLGFSRIGERLLPVWTGLVPFALLFSVWSWLPRTNPLARFTLGGISAFLLLGLVCTAIHAWLCRLRPDASRLPGYYFCSATGGAVGGILAGCIAPLVFDGVAEYPLTLGVVALLFVGLVLRLKRPGFEKIAFVGVALLVAVPFGLWQGARMHARSTGDEISRARGFYGVVTVTKNESEFHKIGKQPLVLMKNGQTTHGAQVPTESYRRSPMMYYAENGVGLAFTAFGLRDDSTRRLKVGAVGLGAGVMATWGREGDSIRFYEISRECIDAATNTSFFTYIADAKAQVSVVEADARLALERERKELKGSEAFDILVIDAYTGDSVPLHLITREAFRLYADVLKPDGVLALHLSNWHINLWPVVKAAAKDLGWSVYGTYSKGGDNPLATETGWAFLTRGTRSMKSSMSCREVDWKRVPDQRAITDSCGSLLFNISLAVTPPLL